MWAQRLLVARFVELHLCGDPVAVLLWVDVTLSVVNDAKRTAHHLVATKAVLAELDAYHMRLTTMDAGPHRRQGVTLQ